MATLLNIHVHREPTVPVIPKMTMRTLGLLTRAVNLSQVVNPTNTGPDDYNNASFDTNRDVWWLALPTELFEAITPATGVLSTLKGNTMCPRWDKLILSSTPSMAMCNLFFHATELHTESSNQADVTVYQHGATEEAPWTGHRESLQQRLQHGQPAPDRIRTTALPYNR